MKFLKSFPPIYFLLWLMGRRKGGLKRAVGSSAKFQTTKAESAVRSKPPGRAYSPQAMPDPYIETEQTREPFKTKPPFEKPKKRKLS